jgi:Amt family ammonium transporter
MSNASTDIYDTCEVQLGDNATAKELLQCVTSSLQNGERTTESDDSLALAPVYAVIFSATLVFFMQSGFAMLCAGSVRLKNGKFRKERETS